MNAKESVNRALKLPVPFVPQITEDDLRATFFKWAEEKFNEVKGS